MMYLPSIAFNSQASLLPAQTIEPSRPTVMAMNLPYIYRLWRENLEPYPLSCRSGRRRMSARPATVTSIDAAGTMRHRARGSRTGSAREALRV